MNSTATSEKIDWKVVKPTDYVELRGEKGSQSYWIRGTNKLIIWEGGEAVDAQHFLNAMVYRTRSR